MNVTHLVIPAELGALLQTAGGLYVRPPRCSHVSQGLEVTLIKHAPLIAVRRELHSDCLALLQAPHIQETIQLTLPLDINNYPFYRYVQIYFRVRCAQRYIHLQIFP